MGFKREGFDEADEIGEGVGAGAGEHECGRGGGFGGAEHDGEGFGDVDHVGGLDAGFSVVEVVEGRVG